MDGHTHSAFGRLEVVETGRRRRWSEDEKARIVLESLAGPRLVSATARRHGISRSQLLAWHRTLRAERSEAAPVPGFVPAVIVERALWEGGHRPQRLDARRSSRRLRDGPATAVRADRGSRLVGSAPARRRHHGANP